MTGGVRPKIVFHIGLERTGSTSFQRYCTTNAPALRHAGLVYPTKSPLFRADNHGPLVASYLGRSHDFAIRSVPATRSVLIASLLKAANQTSGPVLISSEHFSSRFAPADIEALARDVDGFECTILIVVRPHRERFFSAYATSIASGRRLTLEDYADEVLAPDNTYLRYRRMISAWEAAFGRANLVIQPYQPEAGQIHAMLAAIGAQVDRLPAADGYRDNRSLGPTFTEALRLANIALARQADTSSYWSWLQQRYCQVRIKRWLIAAAGTSCREPWPLGAGSLAKLDAIAAADAVWLASQYGVDIGSHNPVACQADVADRIDATEILAEALKNRILGQWNVVDAAMPALQPLVRVWDRWRLKGLQGR